MFTCLFLLAPPAPIDLEAEKARIAVQVAIAIAKAKEVKPAPTPKVEPTPAVVVPGVTTAPRFTQDGARIPAPSAVGHSTGFPATYRQANTPIPVFSMAPYGATRCSGFH